MMAPVGLETAANSPSQTVETRVSAPSPHRMLRGRPLSPREYECLRLYAWLGRWRDVAAALGIHPETVRSTVQNAYIKLDVGFATQAFRELGWLQAPGPEAR